MANHARPHSCTLSVPDLRPICVGMYRYLCPMCKAEIVTDQQGNTLYEISDFDKSLTPGRR